MLDSKRASHYLSTDMVTNHQKSVIVKLIFIKWSQGKKALKSAIGWMDGRMNGRTDGRTDGWMDG